jgi:hypothetical protein
MVNRYPGPSHGRNYDMPPYPLATGNSNYNPYKYDHEDRLGQHRGKRNAYPAANSFRRPNPGVSTGNGKPFGTLSMKRFHSFDPFV